MTVFKIRQMQAKIGVTADGFWGPISQAACRKHLRSLMPANNPWPKSDSASLKAFYGKAGDEDNLVRIEFPYPMFYLGKQINSTRVHRECAESLLCVLKNIAASREFSEIKNEAQDFGGVFNNRNKRGGTTKSLHAYGAAIDLAADDNSFSNSWPMQSNMPLEIMECFARESWLAAGAFWGYDAMHFQATQ